MADKPPCLRRGLKARARGALYGETPGAIKMVPPYVISLSLCLYKPEQKFRLLYVFVYIRGVITRPPGFHFLLDRSRHFQISAKCIGELHLSRRSAFRFEHQGRPDQHANASRADPACQSERNHFKA
jgi:hypothetical protein